MNFDFFDSKECEWADMTVLIAGARVTKIQGISYKIAREKEHLYGEGSDPIGIQSGNKGPEGELKFLKGAIDDMERVALAAGADDLTDLEFDIVASYKAKGNRALQQDVLIGCQIKEYQKGWDQGAKSMQVSTPFLFLRKVSS